jgi:DNA ligase-associated metallophosphoesterase
MLELLLGGERVGLLPQRAALLIDRATLLVADAHIGKAVSFRSLGVPVPHGTTTHTLQRLSEAVVASGARRVVFLGDLLHSAHAHAPATLDAFAQWRSQHADLELLLVRGNHDDRAGDPPASLGVASVDEPRRLGAIALCHHPQTLPGAYVLAGHVHPGVVLGGRAGQRLRLPCFHFGPHQGVLPAFGDFTGMHVIRPAPGERVFAIADDRVMPLPVLPAPTLRA